MAKPESNKKNNTSFSWTTSDGFRIYGKDWSIEKPKAVVALAHGLGEHCLRYDHMARYYNSHQIAVVSQDFRGHGQSEGKEGIAEVLMIFWMKWKA